MNVQKKSMSEKYTYFYKLLFNSRIYNFSQYILGASTFRKNFIKSLNIQKNANILDIGCGTSTILDYLHEPNYYGYDINSDNIEYAKKKFGNRGVFENKSFSENEINKLPKFNFIFLFGFIHHLDDDQIIKLLKLLKKCLDKDGCICSIDGVLVEKQNLIAKFLIKRDRGNFVRTETGYTNLAKSVFSSLQSNIIHWKFFPYTYLTMIMK